MLKASSRALEDPAWVDHYTELMDRYLSIPFIPIDEARLVLRERGDEVFEHGYMEDYMPATPPRREEEEDSEGSEEEEGSDVESGEELTFAFGPAATLD